MTDEMMNLCALLEKSSDAELLREMIGFTAQRLMELEVEGPPEPPTARRARSGSSSATATATGCRRRAPGPWSRAFPSCARAATSRAFCSHAG